MKYYIRKVDSLSIWKEGKQRRSIPSNEHAMGYAIDIYEGRGNPSFWLARNDEEFEKIALGLVLRKGSLGSARLVAFEEECFRGNNILLCNEPDPDFPIPSVRELHHVLRSRSAKIINQITEKLLHCHGHCKDFPKAQPNTNNMRRIADRYLDEVASEHKFLAEKWSQP